jgi:hypothetical protein
MGWLEVPHALCKYSGSMVQVKHEVVDFFAVHVAVCLSH